jgi:hypothetical protein
MIEGHGQQRQFTESNEEAPTTIGVLGREDSADRSLFSRAQDIRLGRGEITSTDLQRRLENFLHAMRQIIGGLPDHMGTWQMSTVTLTAEITAKGSVNLLGTGAELSGKGGLTFTFIKNMETSSNQIE